MAYASLYSIVMLNAAMITHLEVAYVTERRGFAGSNFEDDYDDGRIVARAEHARTSVRMQTLELRRSPFCHTPFSNVSN